MLRSLLLSVLLSAGLWAGAGQDSCAVPPLAAEPLSQLKPGHPRLLLDDAGLSDLRRRIDTDDTLRAWDKAVRREADGLLKAPLPRHVLPDGKRLLDTSRRTVSRSYTLSLMYRLHSDRRYAQRLWDEVQTVAAFPDFNPRHFLDTAEMVHALAIAYDWLYDTWSDAQRTTIRQAIVRLGLEPGMTVYRSGKGWPTCTHNWNQVCNAGLTLGALAVADEEPALAREIVRHALASVPRAMASYAPDGAWGEGPGYWGYATSYNVLLLAGLESALGSDFGLTRAAGFDQTGLFPVYMTGPTKRWFNFEDCGEHAGGGAHLLWLAERFNLPVCTGLHTAVSGPSAAAMAAYRRPGQDPAAAGLPLDKHFRGVDVVSLRSRWNDPQAVFVGFQAGSNTVNHNHLDLGSFVLDAGGERWALDLGGDDYNLPGYFGRQRYDYYRLRAEGHNTLVIDPDRKVDQDPLATAKITRFVSRPEWAFAVADLTPAYAPRAQTVQRGIALIDRRRVLLQDEITAREADVWWFLHTTAEISLSADGRTATLLRNKKRLQVRLLTPDDARLETLPAVPLPSSPHPAKQNANQGFRKLAIHVRAVRNLRLTVLLTPLDGVDSAAPDAALQLRSLAEWR